MPAPRTIPLSSALVYIAGVETPVSEITVQYGQGMIPQASVSLPACEELERLGSEDRVPIAIFYLDQWYAEDGKTYTPKFRLLFDGEITGWEYQRSAYSQFIVFQAVSHVAVLESATTRFFMGDLRDLTPMAVSNNAQAVFTQDQPNPAGLLLTKGMFTDGDSIERPFDFIANILLAMKTGGILDANAISTKLPKAISAREVRATSGDPAKYKAEFVAALRAFDNSEFVSPNYFQTFRQKKDIVSAVMAFFPLYVHRTQFDKRWIANPLEQFLTADTLESDGTIVDVTYEIIRTEMLARFTRGMFNNIFGQGDSFLKIISSFYSYANYELLFLPTAQYVKAGELYTDQPGTHSAVPADGVNGAPTGYEPRLGEYISKPYTQFAVPAACNILFPSLVTSLSFRESYNVQPTRSISNDQFLDHVAPPSGAQTPELQMAGAASYPIDIAPPQRTASTGGETTTPAVDENAFMSSMVFPEEFFRGPLTNYVSVPAWYQILKAECEKTQEELMEASKEAARNALSIPKQPDDPISPTQLTAPASSLTNGVTEGSPGASAFMEAQKSAYKNFQEALAYKAKHNQLLSNAVFDTGSIASTYIKMLHYEAKYATRSGSFEMPFNPYIVPGVPFAYLDDPLFNTHLFGLPVQISQRISASSGMATSMAFSYGRTMKEVYEEAVTQFANDTGGTFYESSPRMPVKVLADMLQTNEPPTKNSDFGVSNYYRTLFYTGNKNKTKFAFDFRDYFVTTKYRDQDMPTSTTVLPRDDHEETIMVAEEVTWPGSQAPTVVKTPKKIKVKSLPEFSISLEYQNPEDTRLTDFDAALKSIARPICSLDEYIAFIKGNPIGEVKIEKYGLEVPIQIKAYAVYDNSSYETPRGIYVSNVLDKHVDKAFRRNWVASLLRYREKIHARQITVR